MNATTIALLALSIAQAITPTNYCDPYVNNTYFSIEHEFHNTEYNCNDYSWDLVDRLNSDGYLAYTVLGRLNESYYSDVAGTGLHRAVCVMIEPQTGALMPVESFDAITLGMTKGEREYRG